MQEVLGVLGLSLQAYSRMSVWEKSPASLIGLMLANAASASNDESNTNLDEHKLARARTACRKITSQPPDRTSHSPQLHPQTVARIKAWNWALEAGHQAN
ncbi:hypothetical protein CI102_6974 [Trichoderma harzianum]|nr:hypothetical protein CI102_6974 [Trichoderma harzianum]